MPLYMHHRRKNQVDAVLAVEKVPANEHSGRSSTLFARTGRYRAAADLVGVFWTCLAVRRPGWKITQYRRMGV